MAIRVLLAKPGLDVHDRGIRVIARACRDAGFEVVFLSVGLHTPEDIANVAVQEDVDLIGLSVMTGSPSRIFSSVLDALKGRGIGEIPVVIGGVIRKEEVAPLEALGARGVFGIGSSLDQVIARIQEVAKTKPHAAKLSAV